ncbi:MAG: hypothetical protein M1828_001153 [Chrysothrix sp. TS-e1954]|nr:MAG: hypothetical protein M1828_001153 [Chrysothrix sp. TS-e1954]
MTPTSPTNSPTTTTTNPTHTTYIQRALSLSRRSPPLPTNYRVGALLVDTSSSPPEVLASGYTLELPGNTHAEQVCLMKFAARFGFEEKGEEGVGEAFGVYACERGQGEGQEKGEVGGGIVLYTTMEPCHHRSPGNIPCVERILLTRSRSSPSSAVGIRTVYTAIREPDWLVKSNEGQSVLERNGVHVVRVDGFERDVWDVATAGHVREGDGEGTRRRDERVGRWRGENLGVWPGS